MSYDVFIGQFTRNYTANAGKLFHKHINVGENTGLQALHGMKGGKVVIHLARAWESIDRERIRLSTERSIGEPRMQVEYDSSNGWGSLVGALIFLGEITAACGEFPNNVFNIYY